MSAMRDSRSRSEKRGADTAVELDSGDGDAAPIPTPMGTCRAVSADGLETPLMGSCATKESSKARQHVKAHRDGRRGQ